MDQLGVGDWVGFKFCMFFIFFICYYYYYYYNYLRLSLFFLSFLPFSRCMFAQTMMITHVNVQDLYCLM